MFFIANYLSFRMDFKDKSFFYVKLNLKTLYPSPLVEYSFPLETH